MTPISPCLANSVHNRHETHRSALPPQSLNLLLKRVPIPHIQVVGSCRLHGSHRNGDSRVVSVRERCPFWCLPASPDRPFRKADHEQHSRASTALSWSRAQVPRCEIALFACRACRKADLVMALPCLESALVLSRGANDGCFWCARLHANSMVACRPAHYSHLEHNTVICLSCPRGPHKR